MAPNWDSAGDEVVAQLQRLIRFKTVNPPGDELPLARYLHETLSAAGIDATLIEIAPTRAAVIATIHGTGARPPVMLVAHTDVVDAEAEHWSTDPFGGEIRDGCIYGRGAIDDKGMLAANLVTMLLLKRELDTTGATPLRDIIFLATPDEEAGGANGMGWLATHRPDLLRAEYAINEGGRIRIAEDGTKTLLLQTAEKVSHVVTFTARGHAGHAGVPRPDNAILRIGRALARISDFASDPANGVSPTILTGGSKFNVIPGEASVLLNIRTRPTESIDTIITHLTTLIADPALTITIVNRGTPAPASPEDSPLFATMAACARQLDPSITVTPYLSNGITDSARLRQLGVKAYGVLPFPLTLADESRMHGHDERVPITSLIFGTKLLFTTITKIAH